MVIRFWYCPERFVPKCVPTYTVDTQVGLVTWMDGRYHHEFQYTPSDVQDNLQTGCWLRVPANPFVDVEEGL